MRQATRRRSARCVFLWRVLRLHPSSLLVADGQFESRRLRPREEEESLSHLETVTTRDRKERKGGVGSSPLLMANGSATQPDPPRGAGISGTGRFARL